MKGIISSITDVITNSSSEVFVMCEENADAYANIEGASDCIRVKEITWSWIENNGDYEFETIAEICGLDLTPLISSKFFKIQKDDDNWYNNYWHGYPDKEDWLVFIDMNRKAIEENLIGKYWVDIEDHFENAYEVTESARHDSIWSESRH